MNKRIFLYIFCCFQITFFFLKKWFKRVFFIDIKDFVGFTFLGHTYTHKIHFHKASFSGLIHIPLIDFLEVLCALLHEIFLQFFQPGEQPYVVRFQLDRLFPDILSCFATYAVH